MNEGSPPIEQSGAVSRPDSGGQRTAALRVRQALAAIGSASLDLIFPPGCIACGRATGGQDGLCSLCWRGIRFIERPFCDRLGTPFVQDFGAGSLSPEALSNPPGYGRARAVARFEDGPARLLVHRLKYGDRLELARPLGLWMARAGAELLAEADVVVPIPLHRRRLWSRRFNQAAALAAEIARVGGVDCDPFLLERVKATATQVGMTRTQRMENVQGAFRVPRRSAPGPHRKRVLLVDDVLTTGATLNAAAHALLRGGAAAVDVLVFARVVTES